MRVDSLNTELASILAKMHASPPPHPEIKRKSLFPRLVEVLEEIKKKVPVLMDINVQYVDEDERGKPISLPMERKRITVRRVITLRTDSTLEVEFKYVSRDGHTTPAISGPIERYHEIIVY